jgi:hypothetical protein
VKVEVGVKVLVKVGVLVFGWNGVEETVGVGVTVAVEV